MIPITVPYCLYSRYPEKRSGNVDVNKKYVENYLFLADDFMFKGKMSYFEIFLRNS